MKPCRAALIAVVTIAATAVVPAAGSYQPDSHVTRGICADISAAMQGSIWSSWGDGFTYVDEGARGGRSCVRCGGKADARAERLFQAINWDDAPRSVAIAKNRGLDAAATEAYHLRPDGRWQPWTRALGPELRLGPQEAVVARLTGGN